MRAGPLLGAVLLEVAGVVFRDAAGTPQDCLTTLKSHGINTIRLLRK